ncbi:MAG: hypothetical protein G8345_18595 [Magnetococcales bacterium]|nr:hypothetical protein [Magnetococcales bacterium]NGZ28884.1 hypothetical protein [Magnetococcales bacterium]
MHTITLPDDLAGEFQLLVEETGKTLTECVIISLRHYLEELEECQDREDAAKALEVYRKHPERVVTMDQISHEFGLSRKDVA